MAEVSIRDAIRLVADNPEPATDIVLDVKVHELVARTLFDIANNPDSKVRGSLGRASRAQRIILNRHDGLRRPGTHPAAREAEGLDFVDLTAGVLE